MDAPPQIPSYGQGFNRFIDPVRHPHLMGVWAPFPGPTGLTLYDQSSQKNHGVLTNMTVSDWRTCQYGAFLAMDGANDRIDIPNVMNNAGRPQTFMFWMNPNHVLGNESLMGTEQAGGAWAVGFLRIADTLRFDVVTTLNPLRVATVPTVTATWQQVTLVWDGTLAFANVRFYRNGIPLTHAAVGNQNGTGVPLAALGPWVIGGRTANDLLNYTGSFILAAWWDYMLPVPEIHRLYKDPHYLLREAA